MYLIERIGELLTMDVGDGNCLRGAQMANPGIVESAALVYEGDTIVAYGDNDEILSEYGDRIVDSIDAGGALVTPGFVDPHTHSIFIGTRELEFEMRIRGMSYMQIAEMGGGILHSTEKVRDATEDELVENALLRFDRMLSNGITTVEVKSGYGLETEAELKMLRAIRKLSRMVPQDIVPTFLGAHEVPAEFRPNRRDEYVDIIINEMIPMVASEKLAKFCDVFCEAGVFDVDDTRRILESAKQNKLGLKLHADEIEPLGGAELGVDLGARSVDHIVAISDIGVSVLAASNTAAVLLPGTSFFLAMNRYAPARSLIDSGAIVAMATDFNPGSSPTTNMPLIMSIACTQMKMTPAETWTAATINSAYAVGMQNQVGSIKAGKQADIIIWNAENHRQIPYAYGENNVEIVIKKGKTVWRR